MITARFDFGDVEKGLRAVANCKSAKALRQFFVDLKKPLHADQVEHARGAEGPEGNWAPRARATIEKASSRPKGLTKAGKRQRRQKPGKLLGRLPSAIRILASHNGLIAESKVPWSGVHQEGGNVGRGARVPARPFLWFSSKFMDTAVDRANQMLQRAWSR